MTRKNSKLKSANYIADIRRIIATARQKAYTSVNSIMIEAYWQIGMRIVEEEQHGRQRALYGEGLIKELSKVLSTEFGKGFSVANLENFRKFYLTFPKDKISDALRRELTWTHYRLIMRVDNPKAREYYINECAEQMWSSRTLERNINSFYYERLLSSQKSKNKKLPSDVPEKQNPEDFVKDPYVFEFLNIPEPMYANERKIESALIQNLQRFLLELGRGFSFVERQFRISTETSHFYIDLVFYNYILKCFVLFDIKTTKLSHQDIGQMDMYVRMFNDLKRSSDDNPTIGIILCAEKDETVVKYSVMKENKQLFATRYKHYLPTEEELIREVERGKKLIADKFRNNIEEEKI